MPRKDYHIVVVDTIPKPWPSAKQLADSGVPISVAHRYAVVRRTMNPAGLKKKAQAQRN